MNLHGPSSSYERPANDAALREAVVLAQARELHGPRMTATKGPTRGGRRVVIVEGDAQQHALQDVVW